MATAPAHGAGHFARMRALAGALPGPVGLFTDPDNPWRTALADDGHEVIAEAADERCDALLAAAVAGRVDVAVIDSYTIPPETVATLAARCFTVAFTDGGPRPPSHLAVGAFAAAGAGGADLGGTTLAPLAPGFASAHRGARARSERQSGKGRILVAFGARDSGGLTELALDALDRVERAVRVTVALGAATPALDSARALHVDLVTDAEDMIGLYETHDIAVGAPGVSFLERLCCGLPSVLVAQNCRHRPSLDWASRVETALVAEAEVVAIARAVQRLLDDDALWRRLRASGLRLIDGHGAARLAGRLYDAWTRFRVAPAAG